MFDYIAGNVCVFIDMSLYMTIMNVPETDEDFQKEIDSFMDSWNVANSR
jgi:hypothetical protein